MSNKATNDLINERDELLSRLGQFVNPSHLARLVEITRLLTLDKTKKIKK